MVSNVTVHKEGMEPDTRLRYRPLPYNGDPVRVHPLLVRHYPSFPQTLFYGHIARQVLGLESQKTITTSSSVSFIFYFLSNCQKRKIDIFQYEYRNFFLGLSLLPFTFHFQGEDGVKIGRSEEEITGEMIKETMRMFKNDLVI